MSKSKIAPNRDITQGRLLRSITDNLSGEGTRFAFLLGAGASSSSGIGTAAELARKWVEQLKEDDPEVLHELGISDGDEASKMAQAYSAIYQYRFSLNPADGYQELEKVITAPNVEPSLGYIILAKLMLETSNNLVLTVNFDRLTETALLTLFKHHAKVIYHESMLPIIRLSDRKPAVVKIHNDIFFQPMSEDKDISTLSDVWKDKVDEILNTYHLIVLGYGGNDREGLMKHLTKAADPNRVYWCYLEEYDIPEPVIERKYYCVQIDGFDQFMFALNEQLVIVKAPNIIPAKELLKDAASAKHIKLDDMYKIMLRQSEGSTSALANIQKIAADSWWEVELEVRKADTTDAKNALYQEGVRKFSSSAELIGNYAIFLKNIRKDYDQAEHYYRRALDLNPNHANNNGNYAIFLKDIRQDYDQAERYYKKALEFEPNHANNNGNYAIFLKDIRQDYDQAERYYKKALELDPNEALYNSSYANFLKNIRHDYDQAEQYYKKALKLDPNHLNTNSNYANFLTDIRKDHDQAEQYYKKALELDPNEALYNSNYANFLKNIRHDYDQAEQYYKKALELDPDDANTNSNYGLFSHEIRKNYDQAEHFYKKALELDPNHVYANGNYANFLTDIRKDHDQAEHHYKKALELDPNVAVYNGNYANFLAGIRKDYDQAEQYYKKALELDPNNADTNGNYAIFLTDIRKDYDQAEQYYKKALELDPNHANNNGNYANFLAGIRKDHGQAEHYYKKALELDPNHANTNGNYAGFLLAQGRKQEASAYLKKAEKLSDRRDLDLDLTFYRLAHFPNSSTESKTRILKLLAEGVRLIHSDFSANIDRAEQDGCEYVDELRELAARITTAE